MTLRMKTREERLCPGTVQRQCMLNDIKESQLEGRRKEGNLAGQGDSLERDSEMLNNVLEKSQADWYQVEGTGGGEVGRWSGQV